MKEILNKKYSFIRLFLYTFKISFIACPLHFILFITLDVVNCLLTFGMTYCMTEFFGVVEKSSSYSKDVIIALGILYIVNILQHTVNGVGHSVIPALKLKLDRNAMVNLQRKMKKIPPIWFENTEFLDFIEKAHRGTDYTFALLVPMLRFLFQYGPYCVILGIYLYRYDPILALCVILIFVPTFLSTVIRPDIIFNLEDKVAPIQRIDTYIKRCVGDPQYFKETRTLGIFSYFKERFLENVKLLNKHIWDAQIRIKLIDFATTFCSVCGYAGVMVLLVISLLKGTISTAIYASVLSSITMMYAMCDDAAYHFLAPFDGIAIVNNFVALIKAELPEKEECNIDFEEDIFVEDISFAYPNSEKKAINNVSFKINKGETIAVVGINGSGKTTLSKILLGLYTPDSGVIKIGNVDITKSSIQSIGNGMTAVFQKFQKYKMSVADNIIVSDSEKDDNYHVLFNKYTAKLDITDEESMYTDGYDTMLSRDFDGIELSGGQWQKLAIARGIYRNRHIIVLDEPTSAIDPLEETKLYQKFAEISEGKTSLIITHRIGLTKIADRIIVMNQGEIAQIGTYEELSEVDGMFKEMLLSQNKWYIYDEE